MCLKQISPLYMNIRTETSRTEIWTNTVRQGCQRLGQRWKEGLMRSRKKGKGRRRRCTTCMHSESQLELNWHLSAWQCIAFNCTVTTLHTTLLHRHTHLIHSLYYTTPHFKEGAGLFLCMCMFLCGVFVYMSRCFLYFFLCVFCFAGV